MMMHTKCLTNNAWCIESIKVNAIITVSLELGYPIWWIHTAVEHLTCGSSELRCHISAKCTADFEDLVWKRDLIICWNGISDILG